MRRVLLLSFVALLLISSAYFNGFWRSFLGAWGRSQEFVRRENDYVGALVRQHPDRFVGACGPHPFDPWAAAELEHCATLGMRGLKIHPNAQRIDLLDGTERDRLIRFLRLASERHFVILVHAFGKSLAFEEQILKLAEAVPQAAFIFAHMFGDDLPKLVNLVTPGTAGRPGNTYLDISMTVVNTKNPGALATALRRWGTKRVLFASDFPVATPLKTLEALRRMPLHPHEISQILQNEFPH